jgi:hypothetical protein
MAIEGEEWMGVGRDEAAYGRGGDTRPVADAADGSSGYRASIEQTL